MDCLATNSALNEIKDHQSKRVDGRATSLAGVGVVASEQPEVLLVIEGHEKQQIQLKTFMVLVSSSFIANGSTPSGLGLGCTCSLADDLIGLSSVVKLGSSDQIGSFPRLDRLP
ncbi:hypothetical protein LWI28_017176 [Acer negundo]|uniref:Uncharacterized protein n=1 Tax=Acer negundo TaxID=4023 RepID=A0AAD5P216_ACENE|nr:hypothetical protein LWI28_017176 [Acer negundo]KAK4856712.1 hypothetical protein QYF36_020395 [Acer negundo]